MWCPACRADVAAELSFDSRHFSCARCSTELGTAAGSLGVSLPSPAPPTDAERNARELLARWNAQNLLESPTAPRNLPVMNTSSQPSMETKVDEETKPVSVAAAAADDIRRRRRRRTRRALPESSHQFAREIPNQRTGNWGMTVGQICAYFGIGLITCGTAVVLWAYFGGPIQYAPTGWLVTTVGQMFLFLGVVTLVSSGMEQTSAEVAARIDVLDQRLLRSERRRDAAGSHRRQRRRESASDSNDVTAKAA